MYGPIKAPLPPIETLSLRLRELEDGTKNHLNSLFQGQNGAALVNNLLFRANGENIMSLKTLSGILLVILVPESVQRATFYV